MIFYQDLHATLYNQDFRKNDLPDESAQCVVTSPPYWGLRKYSGVQDLIWGDNHCEHEWGSDIISKANDSNRGTMDWKTGDNPAVKVLGEKVAQGNFCSLCDAWKGSYGLEPAPELYIQHTIEILREIRRVLRKDGVVFWNIGDSYSGSGQGGGGGSFQDDKADIGVQRRKAAHNLKPKDLCLIPFRVAIAAQEDGWWVRSVIIWSKPNPMPESVRDRPTESHEYILLLTKNSRYYWDADAVREAYTEPMNRWGGETLKRDTSKTAAYKEMQNIGYSSAFRVGQPMRPNENGRNIRSVWEFPTQPYPEAHFAVFPEKLPEICIKAATPEVGCCSTCGAPWERVTSVVGKQVTEAMRIAGCKDDGSYEGQDLADYSEAMAQSPSDTKRRILESMSQVKESTWQATCKCDADAVPSTVLDPFAGAGTTLWVAKKLNRRAVGFELSEEYCQLTVDRLRQQVMI